MKLRKIFENEDTVNLTHEVLTHHGYRPDHRGQYIAPNDRSDSALAVHDSLKGIGWKPGHVYDQRDDYDDETSTMESGYKIHTYRHTSMPNTSLNVNHAYNTRAGVDILNPHDDFNHNHVEWQHNE